MRQADLLYCVRMPNLHAHLFHVTLTIAKPAAKQVLSLPVWIPGSYLVREFSKNLQCLKAFQNGVLASVGQIDKCTWQVDCEPDHPLEVSYEIYAFDSSVRTAWLDSARGFFNGTSLFLQVVGQQDAVHELDLLSDQPNANWQVATGLTAKNINANGFGRYLAASYDELVDCPVEMGSFWSGSFDACGIPHRFVVAGAPPGFDGARLLNDSQAICEMEINFWPGKVPHANYLFMLNAVDDGYGGLEHRNSTALICQRKDLPRQTQNAGDGYTTLLGLISHEYFHTWNVKQLRPEAFTHYNYSTENYTQLLWFFEGFTSYYDDLLLCRAGLIDAATYLKLLGKTINQVLQTPGRNIQSVAQASLDAWVKYYRQDENTPNATVSYYTKGSLVALCLDLSLRQSSNTSLDAVMRALWHRCQGGPMTEDDLIAVLQALSGRSYASEIAQWVHGTDELPMQPLLEAQGIRIEKEPAALAQQLGLRVAESTGIQIKSVLRGSAAEQAGFAAGDEWLGITLGSGVSSTSWRIHKLDDLTLYSANASHIQALVSRDKRLLTLSLTLPEAVTTWKLVVQDQPVVKLWLGHSD